MPGAENIFLLSIHMLLGVSLLLLLLMGYLWYITKDKIIGIYGIFIFWCFCLAIVKLVNISTGNTQANIMENVWSDELMGAVAGLGYIFFFGWVFGFNEERGWQKWLWNTALVIMSFQILLLLSAGIRDEKNYFNPTVAFLLLSVITLLTLVLLVFAFLKKKKSRFQEIILAGGVVFYTLVLSGNLSEFFFKKRIGRV